LRDIWQDIDCDRFVQANQNALVQPMSYFSYPGAFTFGNVGRNTFDRQRSIDTQFSASKEWRIKERASATFRFDFQNPFKWYSLSAPNKVVNFTAPANVWQRVNQHIRRRHDSQCGWAGADEHHPLVPVLAAFQTISPPGSEEITTRRVICPLLSQ
jgi:hypothetical protein